MCRRILRRQPRNAQRKNPGRIFSENRARAKKRRAAIGPANTQNEGFEENPSTGESDRCKRASPRKGQGGHDRREADNGSLRNWRELARYVAHDGFPLSVPPNE